MYNIRVVVTGGRTYKNQKLVYAALDKLYNNQIGLGSFTLIEGGATGADTLAREWSYLYKDVILLSKEADWIKYKLAAGSKRNLEMVKLEPDICLAFPGGIGTQDMMERCKQHNIKVVKIGW